MKTGKVRMERWRLIGYKLTSWSRGRIMYARDYERTRNGWTWQRVARETFEVVRNEWTCDGRLAQGDFAYSAKMGVVWKVGGAGRTGGEYTLRGDEIVPSNP